MNNPFSLYPELLVRTPRYAFTESISEQKIEDLFNDDSFLEALYLASPVLHRECNKYKKGLITESGDIEKLKKTVVKYYLRSISRCTPFGLFSGCTVSQWSSEPDARLVINSTIKRHTRLDMHYLCALAQELALRQGIKEQLLYFTNNSYYNIGDETRYVEYKYFLGSRIHQISSVDATDYLEELLKKAVHGITIQEIIRLLEVQDADEDEIQEFINELISSQLLVSELEPAITGEEFVHQILHVLKRVYSAAGNKPVLDIIEILETVIDALGQIDLADLNPEHDYQVIMLQLDKLNVPYEEGKLFQTDMYREVMNGGLSKKNGDDLLDAVRVLNRFGAYQATNPNLESFSKRFYDRYEDGEMPLLEVLDTETGIGYLEAGAQEHIPLVEDIVFSHSPNPTHKHSWGPIEKYLMNRVSIVQETGADVLEIKEEDMEFLTNANFEDLPPSMYLMFRIIDADRNLLYLEHCGGSSAAALLGRFAHTVAGVRNLVNGITDAEEKQNPDVIFAEIIHLPESRVGNVILHPPFRKFEIPYLSQSSLPVNNQIYLQNLMISIRQGKLILRCKVSNKLVIPRLSSAHNFQSHALPVYQFLCDMQLQQQRPSLAFNWGSIMYMIKALPRVQYKNVIVSPATWRLLGSDYAQLLNNTNKDETATRLKVFIARWRLPRFIVIVEGDNELLIDFDNFISVNIFLDTIKKRPGIELREFMAPRGKAVSNQCGGVYNNQVIAALIKNSPTYQAPALNSFATTDDVNAVYIPGSQWVYYKIYCGTKSADKILTAAIKPIVDILLQKKLITRFFFIRYYDPSFHIRFRLELTDSGSMGAVSQIIHEYLSVFHKSGLVWKIQTDTYKRETRRYGAKTIGLAEHLFFRDSEAVLQILSQTWGDAWEEVRWLITLRTIDQLLDAFNITPAAKVEFTEMLRQSFATEFKADKFLKSQLNAKFRNYRPAIEKIMNKSLDETSELKPLLDILKLKQELIKPVALEILEAVKNKLVDVSLTELLGSYIHMLVNRIISSKARLHEMVIYDFLNRHYKGEIAKSGQAQKFSIKNKLPEAELLA